MRLIKAVAALAAVGLLAGCCCIEDRVIPWPSESPGVVSPQAPTEDCPDCFDQPGTPRNEDRRYRPDPGN